MSRSYDDLLQQVEGLRLQNTSLHRELLDNSAQLSRLESEGAGLMDAFNQSQSQEGGAEYADDSCREHMATFEDGSDINDTSQTQIDTSVVNSNPRGHASQGQHGGQRSQSTEPPGGQEELLDLMQHLDTERTNLLQQIEAEDKNRKWYYDQIEMISRKIRSLPISDNTKHQQPGLTRSHLEFEISRLRETMHDSFGTNEQIVQRRDARIKRIQQIETQVIGLQQHRQQLEQNKAKGHHMEDQGHKLRSHSSSDSAQSDTSDLEPEVVTMATQTEGQTDVSKGDNYDPNTNIPAIYHGSWPINKDENNQGNHYHNDLASVMSFNSTNTSSSHGSGQSHRGVGGQHGGQQQGQGQIQQQTMMTHGQQIPPQQLGTKVEMVYGLLSMLGTHDKDDMSRTLLAMSSSQDSCIAMRQSGCMPLLIQLLHGSDKESALLGNTRGSKAARARAAAALHNIVHSHPDDKRGRREARVLRLLEQIRAHCDQLQEVMLGDEDDNKDGVAGGMDHHPGHAIATLMKLSFDEEHRHAICTLGGLHAIAELLQVDNEVHRDTTEQYNITMRRYACMALTNLTFGDGTNKAILCSMKSSMEALVMQLFSSNEELCQVAASVLRNLSWKADLASKKTLREVGAVTSLMESSMRVAKESTLKSILSALWNLSAHCSENKADICAVVSALQFLINSLTYKSPSKTTAIIENGGGILRNVSSHIAVREDYRETLRQHGCLQILLKHLRSPSLTIVSNACGTLWNLSARCAEDQQALWEMGAVTMLRNLINSKHKMISMGSSAALKNLLAARPAMKNIDHNKQSNGNRPSLHVRKQRALESEIDQNLSETCDNVESPRDSPVETKKSEIENTHFMYPVFPLPDPEHRRPIMRGQFIPRSRSGDNSFSLENQLKASERVSRSGSQDSVGSTHSDISHDRSRTNSGNKASRVSSNMGGSLDRNKEVLLTPGSIRSSNQDGRCERNPLGPPNSRILQVMQEVAMHAGLEGQEQGQSSHSRSNQEMQNQNPQMNTNNPMFNAQQVAMIQRLMFSNAANMHSQNFPDHEQDNRRQNDESDEKPLDYSKKYRDNSLPDSNLMPPPAPAVGNFVGGKMSGMQQNLHNQFNGQPQNGFMNRPVGNTRFNSAYAETDLDAPDQLTDYSQRYGAEYNAEHYADQQTNYRAQYEEPDPNCADCQLEEARRYNDRLDQATEHDQVTTFCTEDTPYLSTATSLTDLSTAVKILEEAEQVCPDGERDTFARDEIQNFSSKYGESGSIGNHGNQENKGQTKGQVKGQIAGQGQCQAHRYDGDKSSRSGSQSTDFKTATTIISNYHLKFECQSQDSQSESNDEGQERSFHDTRSDNAPDDEMRTYCEEGTPTCFSRVSSLSSLHSSEANDRQEKRPSGPLQSITETDDMNSSIVKMPPPPMTPNTYRQKNHGSDLTQNMLNDRDAADGSDNNHGTIKTVTFDDKEQIQETPMMFSRCTSLGSLSSFDTQSVHSSVFSEYSRRASEVVSPSELPDSPSESMPSSPRRTKSPERFHGNNNKKPTKQELFPPKQFTDKANEDVQRVNPLSKFLAQNHTIGGPPIDEETESLSKSEAPVVYADEGTPPVFSDNMSQLSGITMDNYEINDKTVMDTPSSRGSHGSSSHGNQDDTLVNKSNISTPSHFSQYPSNTNSNNQYHSNHNNQYNTNNYHSNQNNQYPSNQSSQFPSNQSSQFPSNQASQFHSNQAAQFPSNQAAQFPSNQPSQFPSNQPTQFPSNQNQNKDKMADHERFQALKKSEADAKMEQVDDKGGNSSVSDVSEGEDDLLANVISSAMPNSSRKMRKSSSDNAIRRKSGNSSKTDSGSSSRSSKTPAKNNQSESPPKTGSGSSSAKKNNKMSSSSKTSHHISQQGHSLQQAKGQGQPAEMRSHIPVPTSGNTMGPPSHIPVQSQNRQITRHIEQTVPLDLSTDSVRSVNDDTPFNKSSTQSVINRQIAQNSDASRRNTRPDASILEKAGNLPSFDEDEGCKTYTTEDTPFSGSIPASPRNDRKFTGGYMHPDMNHDSVQSFATEGTPFSGSAPGSPKMDRVRKINDIDNEQDSVKNFNTEDTPFSGSPKLTRKSQPLPQPSKQVTNQSLSNIRNECSQMPHKVVPNVRPQVTNKPKLMTKLPPPLDLDEDCVKSYATEGTPLNGSNLPSPKPNTNQPSFQIPSSQSQLSQNPSNYNQQQLPGNQNSSSNYNPQMLNSLKNFNDDYQDSIKTFAEEGTPLNYSRTGSCSDLSSLNANFEEKVSLYPPSANEPYQQADDTHSDNSSLMEDCEDLLSEVIQSAMPTGKITKSSRQSMDRVPDGAQGKGGFRFDNSSHKPSKIPAKFQPQRTSSLAYDPTQRNTIGSARSNQEQNSCNGPDEMRVFAVEDTPNMSGATSLSNLTIDSISQSCDQTKGMNSLTDKKGHNSALKTINSSMGDNSSLAATYGTSNDSVFLHSELGASSSMKVYQTEGTPQSFSCNDSLSSLSIMTDDDSKNEVSQQIKALAQQIMSKADVNSLSDTSGKECNLPVVSEKVRSESRTSVTSGNSVDSVRELERHVIGQSSEDQQKFEEQPQPIRSEGFENEPIRRPDDEIKSYGVEDTPLCFSRSSSLSSIHDMEETNNKQQTPSVPVKKLDSSNSKLASADQRSGYKVEHTPICFSRNSSLSSLSVCSDDDDDPEDLALLEDCMSSALPQRTRPSREDRHRSSHSDYSRKSRGSSDSGNGGKYIGANVSQRSSARDYSSADELQQTGSGTHDSRYSDWRQQPAKSADDIFRVPTMDSKGRPCRRSRSEDGEKIMLKQYKDVSNQELAQGTNGTYRGSFDSLSERELQNQQFLETERQRQQIISESQNIARSIEKRVRELNAGVEKSDENENEKNESPTDEQNFFMMCSGATEISVESISKQSFPSSMAPDHFTDDDILNDSLVGSYRIDGEGGEGEMVYSRDTTLTEKQLPRSMNTTLTESYQSSGRHQGRPTMEASITSEDERALAENANIVMSEMLTSRMGISGSTVDDDKFIEHETLSLVSNGYTSDTASEASVTWSASSGRTSECSNRTFPDCDSPSMRRPRILKPGETPDISMESDDPRGVRGRRKPLYSNKPVSVSSASNSSVSSKCENRNKGKQLPAGMGTGKVSPRTVPGAQASKKSLRTVPQACSTPVKVNPNIQNKPKSHKPSPPQRSSSLDKKSPRNLNTTNQKERNLSSSSNTSNTTPTKIPSKSSNRTRCDGNESQDTSRKLSKQGTFIKESTNKNAPIISPEDKNGVKMRTKKRNDSVNSQSNRCSTGSAKSNQSNNQSSGSCDSPPETWNKALNSFNFIAENESSEKKKDKKLRRSFGSTQLPNSSPNTKKNLNSSLSPNTKIPSPNRANVNRANGRQAQQIKTNNRSSPITVKNGSGLKKTGSNSSLKKIDAAKPTDKKPATSKNKISNLWKKDESKPKPNSKLPVAKSKGKPKSKNESAVQEATPTKRESSPRPSINRNTIVLSESSLDGISRSSTYDKLNATNEHSQIPSHDTSTKAKKSKSFFLENELDKTCRNDIELEIGVEYNLDDAWASSVENSIAVMSRSIEENKSKCDSYYDDTIDNFSKMDLTGSPAKRLSKSGSMSEIELEFGRIHSGTWKKKKSHNDFSVLPNADETSRTLPLKKRAASLTFSRSSHECLQSQYDSENEDTDVWIKRDDRMRCSEGMTGKSKKKSFRGSSSFLPIKNVVSKVFGSKKSDKDKLQSKSFSVSEKDLKKLNETSAKLSKKDISKLNKSEIKATKAELKAEAKLLKAEQKAEAKLQKAEAKLNKSEIKVSKKESKTKKGGKGNQSSAQTKETSNQNSLNKSQVKEYSSYSLNNLNKDSVIVQNKDLVISSMQGQKLNSSTSSLKKSSDALIDIDKSDDDSISCDSCSMVRNDSQTFYDEEFAGNSVNNSIIYSSHSANHNQTQAYPVSDNPATKHQNGDVKYSVSKRELITSQISADKTMGTGNQCVTASVDMNQSNVANKTMNKSTLSHHATKTEMLMARRQQSLNTSCDETDEDGKRKCIVTTV